MTRPKQNKTLDDCEKQGLAHAWFDITPNVVYPTNPPQYPPKTEKCANCGKVRELITVQKEVKEWQYE